MSAIPFRTPKGFASCKAFGRSISASLPNPQTPFPVKGCVCFVGFASLQSLWAYTPGVRAGAECGAAALTKQGRLQSVAHSRYARKHKDSHTKPLHDATAQMAVNAQMRRHKRLTTRIGATPKARMLWLLAKSFARCKTNRASNAKHPFLITIEFFQQKSNPPSTVNSVTADNLILKRIFRSYSVKIQCPAVYLICSVIKQIFYLCTAVSLVQVEIRHCCGKACIGNIGNDAGCSIPYILSV